MARSKSATLTEGELMLTTAVFFRPSGKKLDQIELPEEWTKAVTELREAGFSWIEFHTERNLQTREFLETT